MLPSSFSLSILVSPRLSIPLSFPLSFPLSLLLTSFMFNVFVIIFLASRHCPVRIILAQAHPRTLIACVLNLLICQCCLPLPPFPLPASSSPLPLYLCCMCPPGNLLFLLRPLCGLMPNVVLDNILWHSSAPLPPAQSAPSLLLFWCLFISVSLSLTLLAFFAFFSYTETSVISYDFL